MVTQTQPGAGGERLGAIRVRVQAGNIMLLPLLLVLLVSAARRRAVAHAHGTGAGERAILTV